MYQLDAVGRPAPTSHHLSVTAARRSGHLADLAVRRSASGDRREPLVPWHRRWRWKWRLRRRNGFRGKEAEFA